MTLRHKLELQAVDNLLNELSAPANLDRLNRIRFLALAKLEPEVPTADFACQSILGLVIEDVEPVKLENTEKGVRVIP